MLILFVQFFAVVATSITGGTARDAYFLNLFDRSYLPLMYVAIAITMVIVINIYKRITDGKDIIQVITSGGVVFAVILLLIQISLTRLFTMFSAGESIAALPEKWLIPFLFVFMEVIVSLSILQFWMLAGEIFDARQAKRLFSILGAGGSVAGMLAGYPAQYQSQIQPNPSPLQSLGQVGAVGAAQPRIAASRFCWLVELIASIGKPRNIAPP